MNYFSSSSKDNGDIKHKANSKDHEPFFNHLLQPKLTINQPNDAYEQEADAMADKVMRMPDPAVSNNFFFKPAISSIQRKCAHCEEEEKTAQRKEANNEEIDASTEANDYINTLSGGRALNKNERIFFERRMGYDFSEVKIHTDSNAARSAQSINALAYTTGNNIVFNENKFSPDTDSGKKLLAHELSHVVQQKAASTGRMPAITDDDLDTGAKIISTCKTPGFPYVQRQAANCCCCVNSVSLTNITKIDNAARMGHSFKTNMTLAYAAAPADRPMPLLDSCRLEWWERTNVPYVPGMTANVWTDMTQNPSTSGSFTSWAARKEPCPGKEVIVDTDPPSLGKTPGRTVTRTLEFRIRVISSDECGCTNGVVETTATQVLSMVNAAPVWASSSFTTP